MGLAGQTITNYAGMSEKIPNLAFSAICIGEWIVYPCGQPLVHACILKLN